MIRPVAVAIEQQKIAALPCRLLLDGAEEQILERLDTVADSNAQPATRRVCQAAFAAEAVISLAGNVLARAVARVHVVRAAQPIESVTIDIPTIALPQKRMQTFIGLEPKPGEVLENARFVFRPAADPIVILHAQQHTAVHRARQTPHVDGIDDVTEVKVTRRRWGVAREHLIILQFELMSSIPWLESDDPFPPVDHALIEPNGLLAAGADLSPERLLDAYARGIFPWFNEDDPVLWWSPDPRMVLFPRDLHVSRSLRRTIRSARFSVTLDQAFDAVMEGCAAPRRQQDGTWITGDMMTAYTRLAQLGFAHSVETWEGSELVGGLYGVAVGRVFYGESMFSRRSDGSKVALTYLARQLDRWKFVVIDCQMATGHLASLGAREIPRDDFLRYVRTGTAQPAVGGPWRLDDDLMTDL